MANKITLLTICVFLLSSAFAFGQVGSTISNSIDMGVLSLGTYTRTNSNDPVNGYGDYFTGTYNQPSDDIFYKFRITQTIDVSISTVDSELQDTYLHLLDSTGVVIADDDDGDFSGTGYSRISQSLKPGVYYFVAEGAGDNYGGITSTVTLTPFARDLQPRNLNVTRYANSTSLYKLYLDAFNIGLTNSGVYKMNFYLSTDATYSSDDALLGSYYTTDVEGNIPWQFTTSITIPSSYYGLNCYVIAILDPDNTVFETNEGNNTCVASLAVMDGNSLINPYRLGGITTSKTVTGSNVLSRSYGNYYTGPNNQVSDDVFYQFYISSNLTVSFNLSNSDFDTYIHLLDANGNWIASNNDYFGNKSYLSRSLTAGTYYIVVEGNGSNSGNINMVINATKGAPVLNEKDNSISLSAIETYPNPCTDHLSVKCSDLTTDAVLNIYSVSGALVKNIKIESSSTFDVNTSDLDAGIYIFNVVSEGVNLVKKIRVSR